MVKAPPLSSSHKAHGLDKKYKSWRRKQSKNASSNGSLKQQLRGQERLLIKLQKEKDNDTTPKDTTNETRIQQIQDRIQALQEQIGDRAQVERTRHFAKDSHGTRFLERQRLTRMEAKVRPQESSEQDDQQQQQRDLLRIALDQVYVAHYYPTVNQKYLALLRHGERKVDALKVLTKRAAIRQEILATLANHDGTSNRTLERASWISPEQYARLPSTWSVADERDMFGCSEDFDKGAKQATADLQQQDDRFTVKPQQEALLQAALQAEKETLDDDDNDDDAHVDVDVDDGSDDDQSSKSIAESDHGDDSDDADPLTEERPSFKRKNPGTSSRHAPTELAAYDGSSSDSESESDHADRQAAVANADQDDDSSQSSSSSSSSASSDQDAKNDTKESTVDIPIKPTSTIAPTAPAADDDDFLVAANDDGDNYKAFEQPKMFVPGHDRFRGDKSKGWETQRQRPGQFKKRRERR